MGDCEGVAQGGSLFFISVCLLNVVVVGVRRGLLVPGLQ